MALALLSAGFVLGAIGAAIGQAWLLLRLRKRHRAVWQRVCGRNFLFVQRRVWRYSWGSDWRELGDRRIARLVWFVRGSNLVAFGCWLALMILILRTVWSK